MTPRRLLTGLPISAGAAAGAALLGSVALAIGLALIFAAGVVVLLDRLYRKDRP